MTYEFEDVATGKRLEIAMPVEECVSIGSVIQHEGRRVRRLPSIGLRPPRTFHPFSSTFFMENEGRGVPGMEAPAYDSAGMPCFETKHQAREFARKHGVYYGDRGGSYGCYGR